MKKVLMVAYIFPPSGGIGSQRASKFAKYLPQFGWEPVVLAGEAGGHGPLDDSLNNDVKDVKVIERVPAPRTKLYQAPSRLFKFDAKWTAVPDIFKGWKNKAVPAGLDLIKEQGIDAIYSTSFPYTSHLVAKRLKEKTGLPWIADFRDPWTGNRLHGPPTRLHRSIEEKMEGGVLGAADIVVNVTEPLTVAHRKDFPKVDHNKFVTITNGYDPEDFKKVSERGTPSFTILYAGSFYSVRVSEPFIEAFTGLIGQDGRLHGKARLKICGSLEKRYQGRFTSMGGMIEATGYLPHGKVTDEMAGSDLQLLMIKNGGNAKDEYTGKIFEYLGSGRPILALVPPDGVAADLIREAKAGAVVDPDDRSGIEEALIAAFEGKGPYSDFSPKKDVISRYKRKGIASELASYLDGMVGRPAQMWSVSNME